MIKKQIFLTILIILVTQSQLALAQQDEAASELNQLKPNDLMVPDIGIPEEEKESEEEEKLLLQSYDFESNKSVKLFKLNQIIL
jgi:hypothetical protein